MKISFSTLGCPDWSLDTICRRGREYGFDGVDFRGLGSQIDVTRLPEFTTAAEQTRRMLADAGLVTSGLSSSIHICVAEEMKSNLDEARRTMDACRGLDAQNIRVFGGGDLAKTSRDELVKIGTRCIEQILNLDGANSLHWLFETHDIWSRSADCRLLLDAVTHPAFGVLWDAGNTPIHGGESPSETLAALGPRIGSTHIKDARFEPGHPQALADGWRYVNPGQGELPIAESVHLLRQQRYQGWLTFEHEKRWHSDLPEPEEAFPAFAAWARRLT